LIPQFIHVVKRIKQGNTVGNNVSKQKSMFFIIEVFFIIQKAYVTHTEHSNVEMVNHIALEQT